MKLATNQFWRTKILIQGETWKRTKLTQVVYYNSYSLIIIGIGPSMAPHHLWTSLLLLLFFPTHPGVEQRCACEAGQTALKRRKGYWMNSTPVFTTTEKGQTLGAVNPQVGVMVPLPPDLRQSTFCSQRGMQVYWQDCTRGNQK